MMTPKVGYTLIVVGLSITLFAMALDEWTNLRELELTSGCIGLIVSVIAAIIAAYDLPPKPTADLERIRREYHSAKHV